MIINSLIPFQMKWKSKQIALLLKEKETTIQFQYWKKSNGHLRS